MCAAHMQIKFNLFLSYELKVWTLFQIFTKFKMKPAEFLRHLAVNTISLMRESSEQLVLLVTFRKLV